MHRRCYIICLASCLCSLVLAQEPTNILDDINLTVEGSATVSSGDFAPLWLSSNRQGVVSPYANSSYERVAAIRSLQPDSLRQWKRGYGFDIQYNQHAQTNIFIHQAYFDLKWKKVLLTIGQKERQIDIRNNRLTSGGLSQGINAQPVPEVIVSSDYFSISGKKHWIMMRVRGGYGMTTDGAWQKRWSGNGYRYTSNYLYHEKAGYLKIGDEMRFPLVLEGGVQFMTQFGGTAYNAQGRGIGQDGGTVESEHGVKAFIDALVPFGSSDATDGVNQNVSGNTLGSYNIALKWDAGKWCARVYLERYFEDHSQMFLQYGMYDHLLGVDVRLPRNRFVSNVLVEHLSTKDQSGPVFHDGTASMPESFAGNDNYYNHNLYPGWSNYGVSMGTPLLTSPIYNSNHNLFFYNTRVQAWHVGVDGNPTSEISWRALATWTRNWGTYTIPLDDVENEYHLLAEVNYLPQWTSEWSGTLGLGISHGSLIGNTMGCQLTIRKSFEL